MSREQGFLESGARIENSMGPHPWMMRRSRGIAF